MNSFILRVIAYTGDAVEMSNGLHARASCSRDTPISESTIVNVPDVANTRVRDLVLGDKLSDWTLDKLVEDIEAVYGCQLTFNEDGMKHEDGFDVLEIDVFEPAWEDLTEAKDVVDELTALFLGWIEGYPSGRR